MNQRRCTDATHFILSPSIIPRNKKSSGQVKFKIVLDFVVMVVGMVSVSLAEVTHESQVVEGMRWPRP